MKTYYLPEAPAGARFQRTQSDAKAVAKNTGSSWAPRDVPTVQSELVGFLNDLERDGAASPHLPFASHSPAERVEEPEATPVPPKPHNAPQPPSGRITAGQIEEFVLDQATVSEVERIFAVLGTRFAEGRQ